MADRLSLQDGAFTGRRGGVGGRRAAAAVLQLVTAACVVLGAGPARSDPGELLWEDRFDAGVFEQAYSVAARQGRVFVAGFTGFVSLEDARDFLVRTFDARTGELLWEDQVHRGSNDYAAGAVAEGDRVFVSGVAGSFFDTDWLIRSYDARSGALLWEDRFDRAGGFDAPRPDALAVSQGRLFVAGMADNFSVWVVRAYDAATGRLLWQDQLPGALTNAESVVAVKGRVFVAGFNYTATSSDLLVRGYDAATGTPLWQRRTEGPPTFFTTMRGLDSDGERLFAAGSLANASGKNDFFVQACDARTGGLLWQDRVDNGGEFDGAYRIVVRGRRVFAVGEGGPHALLFDPAPPSDFDILLRAYDGKTGAVLWEREAGVVGKDDGGASSRVLAHGGTLYLATSVGHSIDPADGDWLIQAYDGATGQLLWEDLRDSGGGSEGPFDLALLQGRLFVAGRAVDSADNWDFTLFTYEVGDEDDD